MRCYSYSPARGGSPLLLCPTCGNVAEDQGGATYRCARNWHEFKVGKCPLCRKLAAENPLGGWNCTDEACSNYPVHHKRSWQR